uniref:HSF-type DNA-binding domain-containing protein n=1 Tax=Gouania willdenowi TaxID=441366 RepID=A0A8C5N9D8_GOUWI
MDSDPPSQQSLPHGINMKKFPAKLWGLVNDPAITSICWDSRGEEVIIDQFLFEKEVLSQGHHCSDPFHSFHRQLNVYGFKCVFGRGITMGYRHFYNPNFKKGYPELVHLLKRNTVKTRLKDAAHQKTHLLPLKNEKFLDGGEGSVSPVPLKNTMSMDQLEEILYGNLSLIIFSRKIGGWYPKMPLQFNKLPIKLADFHQQAITAWYCMVLQAQFHPTLLWSAKCKNLV